MATIPTEIVSRYNFSFQAKLIQAGEEAQTWYGKIKNELLSYKGVKVRDAWKHETYNKGRTPLAKLVYRGKTLCVYLALKPADYKDTKYIFQDMSDKPKYEQIPMMLKVKSDRGAKWVCELIAKLMDEQGIVEGERLTEIETYPEQTTEELVEQGLVKENK